MAKAADLNAEVVAGLRKQANDSKQSGKARGAIVLVFEKGNVVTQQVLGDFSLYKAIGAVEILKNDLVNQADQIQQGEI